MVYSIKPCPFCGNSVAPRLCDENELATCDCKSDNPYYAVVCIVNAPQVQTPNWENGCGASGGYHATKKDAVAAWNGRYNDLMVEDMCYWWQEEGFNSNSFAAAAIRLFEKWKEGR